MPKNHKRILYELERVVPETGEVERIHRESVVPKEPEFVKLYLENISMLRGLPKWTDAVLRELLRLMNYKNQIVLNASLKKEIAEDLKIKNIKSIDNALGKLVKGQVLIRKDKGIYIGNPLLFGKGEWKDIRELRMTVHYSTKGRTISTEVMKEGDERPVVYEEPQLVEG